MRNPHKPCIKPHQNWNLIRTVLSSQKIEKILMVAAPSPKSLLASVCALFLLDYVCVHLNKARNIFSLVFLRPGPKPISFVERRRVGKQFLPPPIFGGCPPRTTPPPPPLRAALTSRSRSTRPIPRLRRPPSPPPPRTEDPLGLSSHR